MVAPPPGPLSVQLHDPFWAPRQAQLADHTLEVLLDRLEAHGVVDNLRRLSGRSTAPRRGLWFTDSDLYKWMEAAAWAGRDDLLEPIVDVVVAAAQPDGYLHSFYDTGAGSQPRYGDLASSHEWYCGGHLIEAGLAHHATTGSDALLETARRWADQLCVTFGPHRDDRIDGHPEVELALVRLARHTGDERYLAQAKWIIETQLSHAGRSLRSVELAGHAVKALYLASAIAEVARSGGGGDWEDTARRLFDTMVDEHAYPTGAVGGRWLDESVGKPFELPDATAYAESCAAVAALQFCRRIWRLTGDPRALEQAELLAYNAVPCGTGAAGETWFYSQPHAVADVAAESNPWVQRFEYQQSMLLGWFPARRHEWFDVTCCPTNLARMFATIHHHVADVSKDGDLLIHLPIASQITGGGWDVEISSHYPDDGEVSVVVHARPDNRRVLVRTPVWAGGSGHAALPTDGRLHLRVEPEWWTTDPRVEGAASSAFLRRGPVVLCVEGVDHPGIDLRSLVVDPTRPPELAFSVRGRVGAGLHHPVQVGDRLDVGAHPNPQRVVTVPYHSWANRGPTTMRMRFATFTSEGTCD